MRIKFIKLGANTAIGAFSPGDTANTSDELAQHLVDTGVAEFDDGKAKVKAKPEAGGGDGSALDAGPTGKASDGLTAAQIKAALAEKKIEIPAGVTRKDDLAALLDAPQG